MTFSLLDPMGTIMDLIEDNWDSDNINGTLTPDFTNYAEYVTGRTSYQVIFYVRTNDIKEIGRGSHVDWTDVGTIEIRVADRTGDTVYDQIVQEVLRIIYEKRLAPGGGYDYVFVTGMREESYRGKHWYKKLIEFELKKYGVSKT